MVRFQWTPRTLSWTCKISTHNNRWWFRPWWRTINPNNKTRFNSLMDRCRWMFKCRLKWLLIWCLPNTHQAIWLCPTSCLSISTYLCSNNNRKLCNSSRTMLSHKDSLTPWILQQTRVDKPNRTVSASCLRSTRFQDCWTPTKGNHRVIQAVVALIQVHRATSRAQSPSHRCARLDCRNECMANIRNILIPFFINVFYEWCGRRTPPGCSQCTRSPRVLFHHRASL